MSVADVYKVLGVSESASASEIKKAFRRQAKECHPDTHPGDKAAEEKFKEISQAYEILSDDKKRAQYDQMRKSPFGGGGPGGPGGFTGGGFGGGSGSINDLFEMFFGSRGRGAPGGNPFAGGFGQRTAPRGQDLEAELQVPLIKALKGEAVEFIPPGLSKAIRVTLPSGAEEGQKIRLKGKGQAGPPGAPAGDLYLTLRLQPDPRFERDGLDLTSPASVNLAQLMLGGSIEVETLEGRVRLKVGAGTQPGSKLRVRGKGAHKDGKRGDFYVRLELELPDDLDDGEKDFIRAMAKKRDWVL